MKPLLTTITPVWGRMETLNVWMRALAGATIPEVNHILFMVGGHDGSYKSGFVEGLQVVSLPNDIPGEKSIGHYHNLGAEMAETEWIMKLDVDALPNELYFSELLPILKQARPREWFNGGMLTVNKGASQLFLNAANMPLRQDVYRSIMENRKVLSGSGYNLPAATNFICRRKDYLDLGGCDNRFRGWGWEDYQQIFMLESHQLGRPAFTGPCTMGNVTQRCRDLISRPKALALWRRSFWLCLLHRWHEPAAKDPARSDMNRQLVLEHIQMEHYEQNG